MTTNDDQLITRSLHKLAMHAPRYHGFSQSMPNPSRHRHLAPLLASACVVAITVAIGILVSQGGSSETPVATSPTSSSSTPGDSSSGTPTEAPMKLAAAASWPRQQAPDCSAWKPADNDSVVQLGQLDDTCIRKAPRSSTTVLIAPYTDEAPYGDQWTEVTTPWREIGGHQLNRLASGPLMEMNSRVVDALVCSSCNQVIVVLGPDPSAVRELIESVTA